jgi:hypothetical protein
LRPVPICFFRHGSFPFRAIPGTSHPAILASAGRPFTALTWSRTKIISCSTLPEPTGLKNGDKFGWAGEGQMPLANGHEMDIRPSTFAALREQPPPGGGMVPDDPPGIVRIANGIVPWKEGGKALDYFGRAITPKTDPGGVMTVVA